MKFIHLTDTHLVTPGEKLKDLDPAARFAPCIDDINQYHPDAECLIVTGDLADRGEDSAYRFLKTQLSRCGINCYLMIGNHDARDTFLKWFPETPADENGFVQYTLNTSAGVFVLMDTVKTGTHCGEYCEQRRQWLSSTLETHKNENVFLFMHHPPFDLHLPSIDRIGLVEQHEFSEVVVPYKGNIKHLFFGHAHRPLSGNWLGISFSSLRSTNHQVVLDFQNEHIAFCDEPPEYSVVFISEDRLVIHTHPYSLSSNK